MLDITDYMQAEAFYMLTFTKKEMLHILGFGMNLHNINARLWNGRT